MEPHPMKTFLLLIGLGPVVLGLAGCMQPTAPHLATQSEVGGPTGQQQPGAAGAGDQNGPSGGV